jgi:hypothetical protein
MGGPGGKTDAWIPALRTFANSLHQQINTQSAPKIEHEPGVGCGGMEECRALAAVDKFVTDELKTFLTAASQGFRTFESLARRCANEYQNAGERAAESIQGFASQVHQAPPAASHPVPDIPLLGNPYAPSL